MTGVALTERTIVDTRPAYRDYQRRTSTFIPWFPKEPTHEPTA
jgi:steroid 5-alpha reductase family enzyme